MSASYLPDPGAGKRLIAVACRLARDVGGESADRQRRQTASAGLIDHHLSTRPTVELIWIALSRHELDQFSISLTRPEAYRYIDLLSAAFGALVTL